jgi:hypothetical protein
MSDTNEIYGDGITIEVGEKKRRKRKNLSK